jgi:uncharacterized repeat protein (TIGR03833 family)
VPSSQQLQLGKWYNAWWLVISVNGTNRADIKQGLQVLIVSKENQRSGKLTKGIVKDILTKSPSHHHGIKVRLESGEIGRVKEILSKETTKGNR